MVSDFFYPNAGGVESHIYQLSQCLITRGHRVIVITHSYDGYDGIRYMDAGLKVYYLPLLVVYNQSTLPTVMWSFPLVRTVLLREHIDIVHGHSAFSTLALETQFHACALGIPSVFTDHSLFGFADASAIITNKLLNLSLHSASHVICVSHTGKENTALRAGVDPREISVIPNAVDTKIFRPPTPAERLARKNPTRIVVVVVSRLVYRKGFDLMAGVIPHICNKYPQVDFLIGGDGPRRLTLEEVRERYGLQERVTLLGSLRHEQVRDVMISGDIFLNASLTEAFCMAIVEACASGLQVVSTRVGGVPEVLPPELIWLCDPSVEGLLGGLERAIEAHISGDVISGEKRHGRVIEMYQWKNVAARTEVVYKRIMSSQNTPLPSVGHRMRTSVSSCGMLGGPFYMVVLAAVWLLARILDYLYPRDQICDSNQPLLKNQQISNRGEHDTVAPSGGDVGKLPTTITTRSSLRKQKKAAFVQ